MLKNKNLLAACALVMGLGLVLPGCGKKKGTKHHKETATRMDHRMKGMKKMKKTKKMKMKDDAARNSDLFRK